METDFIFNQDIDVKIKNMLAIGYLRPTIAVAIGCSEPELSDYLNKNARDFEVARQAGYTWRSNHPMSEWPDYIQNNELVGKASEYFTQLPFHKQITVKPVESTVDDEDFSEEELLAQAASMMVRSHSRG